MDSTFIEVPSSTKNQKKERDPEAHSPKKGNTWHFGYKTHVEVNEMTELVQHIKTTAVNDHDITTVPDLMHGEEERLGGDSAYIGTEKRPEATRKNKKIKYIICRKPYSVRSYPKSDQYAAKKKIPEIIGSL